MGVFGFRELGLLLRPNGGAIDSKLLYFSLRKWIPRSRNSNNRQYNVHKHLVVTYIERYMVSKGASGFDIIIHSLF
jgi:hypothetical protein